MGNKNKFVNKMLVGTLSSIKVFTSPDIPVGEVIINPDTLNDGLLGEGKLPGKSKGSLYVHPDLLPPPTKDELERSLNDPSSKDWIGDHRDPVKTMKDFVYQLKDLKLTELYKKYDIDKVKSSLLDFIESKKEEILLAWWAEYGFSPGRAALVHDEGNIYIRQSTSEEEGKLKDCVYKIPEKDRDESIGNAKKLAHMLISAASIIQTQLYNYTYAAELRTLAGKLLISGKVEYES